MNKKQYNAYMLKAFKQRQRSRATDKHVLYIDIIDFIRSKNKGAKHDNNKKQKIKKR